MWTPECLTGPRKPELALCCSTHGVLSVIRAGNLANCTWPFYILLPFSSLSPSPVLCHKIAGETENEGDNSSHLAYPSVYQSSTPSHCPSPLHNSNSRHVRWGGRYVLPLLFYTHVWLHPLGAPCSSSHRSRGRRVTWWPRWSVPVCI